MTTIRTAQTSQLREKNVNTITIAAPVRVTAVERLPSAAYEMWPPSSWPIGNRFSAVASRPNQAAKPIGCRMIAWPSGSAPQINHAAALNSSGSPSMRPPASSSGIGVTRESTRPPNSAGTATMKPAIGPAAPTSKSIALVGIRWRMRMKAPMVPARNGAGRK